VQARILIACIGNIFLGDDAFGVEVAERLAGLRLPPHVSVVDFGIRSYDLAYALIEDWELVILVDALARGGEPGSVYLLEPESFLDNHDSPTLDAHAMNPVSVLRLVHALGGSPGRLLVVGCEPESVEPDAAGRIGLSPPVSHAVNDAIQLIEEQIARASMSANAA